MFVKFDRASYLVTLLKPKISPSKLKRTRAVVVAEARCSNPNFNLFTLNFIIGETKINKNRPGMAHLKKVEQDSPDGDVVNDDAEVGVEPHVR